MLTALYFFSTKEDVAPLFEVVEKTYQLRYTLMAFSETPDLIWFDSALLIPDLGVAQRGATAREASYLVMSREAKVTVRAIPQKVGPPRYAVDQLKNPDSVVLTPGGLFDDTCLIGGEISTASNSTESRMLMDCFHRIFRKHFKKQKNYFVGSDARRLYDQGRRLTTDVRSPREYDLRF